MSGAYYNECDPYAAQWLRNLVAAGHIAVGEVDDRSIVDVRADDLRGFAQCHFFAGIGVWSHALRQAGWPDDRPVWTGSCPCQPFSAAGKGEGTDDARHLWPAWFQLIAEHRPIAIFGEQVAAAIRHSWLDLVWSDLEGIGYTFGPTVMGAHSVGAPHIRQRLYFVADRDQAGRSEQRRAGLSADRNASCGNDVDGRGELGLMAHTDGPRRGERRPSEASDGRGSARGESSGLCVAGDVGDAEREGFQEQFRERRTPREAIFGDSRETAVGTDTSAFDAQATAWIYEREPRLQPGKSFWRDADWLPCIDGKARPVEPGTFPLAHGATARVGRLRAYGNAICAPQAAEFIKAYMT